MLSSRTLIASEDEDSVPAKCRHSGEDEAAATSGTMAITSSAAPSTGSAVASTRNGVPVQARPDTSVGSPQPQKG